MWHKKFTLKTIIFIWKPFLIFILEFVLFLSKTPDTPKDAGGKGKGKDKDKDKPKKEEKA